MRALFPRTVAALVFSACGFPATAQVAQWVSVGPAPVVAAQPLAGRVTSIAPDPADASGNTLLLGTQGGGVWKTTNATATTPSFTPLTDNVAAFGAASVVPSLAIGAVSVQPGNTGIYLAGTGEPAYSPSAHYGEGILRSSDSGQTWTLISSTIIGLGGRQSFAGEAVAAFAWNAATQPGASPQTVVAAVASSSDGANVGAIQYGTSARGLYYSQDAGVTWQMSTIQDIAADSSIQIVQSGETNFANYDGNTAWQVIWNPVRQMFFAAVAGHGVYSSPDGVTFTRLATQPASLTACPTDPGYTANPNCPFQYAALAVQPVTGDMFLWFANASGADQGLYLDRCSAASNNCAAAPAFATQLEPGTGSLLQQSNGMALLAQPANGGTTLLAGANALYSCALTPGATSCNFQPCTTATTGQFRALAQTTHSVFAGTGVGVWRGSGCSAYADLNAGLGSIAPTISVAGTSLVPTALLAGAEQLGTAATPNSQPPWPQVAPGDGGSVAIAGNGSAYANTAGGVNITRCTAGTNCGPGAFTLVIGQQQVAGDLAIEHPPLLLDPANPNVLLTGTCRVWRGPADGAGWPQSASISSALDGGPSNQCATNALITTLSATGPAARAASGATVSNILYAGLAGLEQAPSPAAQSAAGAVFVNQAAATSTTWTNIANSPVLNPGLNNGTFNAGQYDVSAVVADSHDPTGATVYATIRGFSVPLVYRSTNFGASWTNVTSNLPDTPANALAIDPNDANTIYIALDQGVFYTRTITQCAAQDCWQAYGSGLPTAQVMAFDTTGGAVGLLRAATRGRGVWQAPLATGSISTNTTASASPTSLTFAPQQESTTSAPQTVTITNTGTLPLKITRVATTGDFAETDTCTGQTVPPGANCTAAVTFSPSALGTRTGTLLFYGNVSGGQIGPIALTGIGLSPPSIQLSPSGTLSFGNVQIGSSSSVQYVLVSNTGQSPATLNSFSATGDFAITQNACGSTLAAQTGCALGIVFTPTARGARSGTFTVTDSAGTQTLGLTGTGEAPANVSLSPTSLTFPATQISSQSSPQTITLTNSGDVSALLTSVFASGDFQAASHCGTSLAGGSSCNVSITFAPTQSGTRTGLLTVTTPFQTLNATLSGTGVGTPKLTLTPPSLSFGTVSIGQTAGPLAMTLTNTGTASVQIVSITTATGTPGTHDYAATSNCPISPAGLAPAQSCTVSVTFSPSISGADPGTLTVQAGLAGASITAALSGTGSELSFPSSNGTPKASVPSGQYATYAVWLADFGATGPLTLSCPGLPSGATCVVPSINLPGSGNISLTVRVNTGSAARGAYSFRLAASAAGASASLPMSLTVQ